MKNISSLELLKIQSNYDTDFAFDGPSMDTELLPKESFKEMLDYLRVRFKINDFIHLNLSLKFK